VSWIVRRPHGHLWVGFRRRGKQHTIRLGKVPTTLADKYRQLVDRLAATVDLGIDPDPEIRAWLERMADGPRRSLVSAGLAPDRGAQSVGALTRRYLESLEWRHASGTAKASTVFNARIVVANLLAYFGEGAALGLVTPEDAEAFRDWLRREGRVESDEALAETTVSRRCRRAREIFELAVDQGWVRLNPWRRMRRFRETNPARDCYVPREVMEAVIGASADRELRLLLALARFGGVRVPSEVQRLTLADLDVANRTVRVRSPKTEYLDGLAERLSPLWPEIEPHARALFDAAPVGQTLALPNLGQLSGAAITARARRAIVAAGVTPWPKLFVNLRASCERDLFSRYPIDDVCTWLGHSPSVALKHYRRTAQVVAVRMATDPSGVPGGSAGAPSPPTLPVRKREGTLGLAAGACEA
jgi:integrase